MKNLKEYASLVNARLEELLPKLPEGSCETVSYTHLTLPTRYSV